MRVTFKNRGIIFLAVTAALSSSGCRQTSGGTSALDIGPSNSKTTSVPSAEENLSDDIVALTSWSMQVHSECPSQPNETCLGSYGFTLSSKGTYKVGPGPEGQVIQGYLSSDEMKSLTDSLVPDPNIELEVPDAPETCLPDTSSTADTTMELTSSNGTAKLHVTSKDFCFSGIQEERAKTLRELVQQYTLKYYPSSFPNPCVNAIHTFEKFFDELRTCQEDSDCSYIDNKDFLPIDPWRRDTLSVDKCSKIKPLLVAHNFKVVSHQVQLLMTRDLAERVCGPDFKRPSCNQHKELKIAKRPPICYQGVCRVHPSAKMSSYTE